MPKLEDIMIFAEVVKEGQFSQAAKNLQLSNGLVSRKVAQLEKELGVALLVRTTRHLQLTREGDLLWQHAQRIHAEKESALTLISSCSDKPKGRIRFATPVYLGRKIFVPILNKFFENFKDINVELILTNKVVCLAEEKLDFGIRLSTFFTKSELKDSSLIAKLLLKNNFFLAAAPKYLSEYGEPRIPEDLLKHYTVGYIDKIRIPESLDWEYQFNNKKGKVTLTPSFFSNDNESNLNACLQGRGIGRFSELIIKEALQEKKLKVVLPEYDWGQIAFYLIYNQTNGMPKRTRLLIDFIMANIQG